MKIYEVSFNDGGWHTSRHMIVANSKEEAIKKVLIDKPHYRNGYDKIAIEFKIEGYVIEVHDEKSYYRNKKIDELL
jgi:hypothetical protein